ncbi:MAG: hypothetical protein OXI96_08705 [Acidimicrobiaceae bacterium]|nr:hypothetical protein [Acidimicrobiaceae bacterium]
MSGAAELLLIALLVAALLSVLLGIITHVSRKKGGSYLDTLNSVVETKHSNVRPTNQSTPPHTAGRTTNQSSGITNVQPIAADLQITADAQPNPQTPTNTQPTSEDDGLP